MYYTYAEKQTSTIFGHWETRLVVFDTLRRYLYYSDPIPTKHSARKSQPPSLSLSASVNPSRITTPNTQYRENQTFTNVSPSRNSSTFNRNTESPVRSGSHTIVSCHTEDDVNTQVSTHHNQSQSHLSSNNNISYNPIPTSNNSISRPPAVRRAASVLEVNQRHNNNTNNESHSHHGETNSDGPQIPEEHPHYREEQLFEEFNTSHSHRSNVNRNPSTLLRPLESQTLFAPTSTRNSHNTHEPSHSSVNECTELDINTLRWHKKYKILAIKPVATEEDFILDDPYLCEKDFFQVVFRAEWRQMAKGETPPAGPLLCPSAAAPPLYLPNNTESKHKKNKHHKNNSNNNSYTNNNSYNTNNSSSMTHEMSPPLSESTTLHLPPSHGPSRTNSFDNSGNRSVVFHDTQSRQESPSSHLLSDEFDDEYIRDPFQLKELYNALREQFDGLKVARQQAAAMALSQGRRPPPPSPFQTIESPKREGLSVMFPPSQDTFTLRCRNEVELRRLWYVIQLVLGYDGLDMRPYWGLPPYDPRNGIAFAHVPLLNWHVFYLLDKSVFYTFMRGHLVGGLQRGNASINTCNNNNSTSSVNTISMNKENNKTEININNNKKDKAKSNNDSYAASKANSKKKSKKDNSDSTNTVMNSVEGLQQLIMGAFLCITHDTVMFMRDVGTIPCWLEINKIHTLVYNCTAEQPFVVFRSDRPAPDLIFVPQPPSYGKNAISAFNPRFVVTRIHTIMRDLCFASTCIRRVMQIHENFDKSAYDYATRVAQSGNPIIALNAFNNQSELKTLIPKEKLASVWRRVQREIIQRSNLQASNSLLGLPPQIRRSVSSVTSSGRSSNLETGEDEVDSHPSQRRINLTLLDYLLTSTAIPLYESTASQIHLKPEDLHVLEERLDDERDKLDDIVGVPLQRVMSMIHSTSASASPSAANSPNMPSSIVTSPINDAAASAQAQRVLNKESNSLTHSSIIAHNNNNNTRANDKEHSYANGDDISLISSLSSDMEIDAIGSNNKLTHLNNNSNEKETVNEVIDLRQDSPENVKNELLLSSLLSRLSQTNACTKTKNVNTNKAKESVANNTTVRAKANAECTDSNNKNNKESDGYVLPGARYFTKEELEELQRQESAACHNDDDHIDSNNASELETNVKQVDKHEEYNQDYKGLMFA